MKVFIHNYPFQHDARNCCHLASQLTGIWQLPRVSESLFFSKFAIPNFKLNKTNIFGDVYYGKVASASIKTIYVECTEGTNEMNKNNKLIIYKL